MDGPKYSLTLDGRRIIVDWNELVAMAQDGRLTAVNTVTTPTGAQVLAHDIPGLFGAVATPPSEAPPVIQLTTPPTMESPWRSLTPPPSSTRKTNPNVTVILILFGVVGLGCCLSVLWPVFDGARSSPERAAAISNVTQIGLGTIMYATDWDDRFPPTMASALAAKPYIMPYSKNTAIFVELNPLGGQILGDKRLKAVESTTLLTPESDVMFYDERDWPSGKLDVVYTDGHATARSTRAELASALRTPLALTKPTPESDPSLGSFPATPKNPGKAKKV